MIAKILLTLGLLVPLAFIFLQAKPVRFLRLGSLLVIGVGIVFVWDPGLSTTIAQAVGIGRGADLVFYVWIIASLAMILVLIINLRRANANITKLTRELAILEASVKASLSSKDGQQG